MINTHWGGVTEDNRFGTHEFMDLCEQLGTEPYICGNVGSGTVQEMSEWVEYLNFDAVSPMADLRRKNGKEEAWSVKFWGVGNENWGCGGNMTADFYADQYRRYATYCRNYGGKKLYKIAGGASSDDFNWTETLMKKIPHHMMDGISLHHYNVVWSKKGSASEFGEEEYFQVLNRSFEMERIIDRHIDIMDRLDPANKVALIVDEWGSWYDVEPKTNPGFLFQQNSMRDAMVAALALNYFNKNCDRIRMTNIAQTVNVLQALIFTKDEKMVLTPTYHVYDLFKVHQDARLLESEMICDSYHSEGRELPAVHHSSSMDQEGKVHISLVNIDPNRKAKVDISLVGFKHKKLSGKILTSEKINDINTFEVPNKVSISEFKDFEATNNGVTLFMPSKSIIVLELK